MIINLPEKININTNFGRIAFYIEQRYRQRYSIKTRDIKFEEIDSFNKLTTAIVQPDFEEQILGTGNEVEKDFEDIIEKIYQENRIK